MSDSHEVPRWIREAYYYIVKLKYKPEWLSIYIHRYAQGVNKYRIGRNYSSESSPNGPYKTMTKGYKYHCDFNTFLNRIRKTKNAEMDGRTVSKDTKRW